MDTYIAAVTLTIIFSTEVIIHRNGTILLVHSGVRSGNYPGNLTNVATHNFDSQIQG